MKVILNLIYWIFVATLCVCMAELSLWVWGFEPKYELDSPGGVKLKFTLDRELLYRLVPDVRNQINSKGFRGPEWQPKSTKFRIVVLGDSFPMGLIVKPQETFPAQLTELLPNTEVINLGIQGYGPDQALLTLERFKDELQPDLILFNIYPANDLNDLSKNSLFTIENGQLVKTSSNPITKVYSHFKLPLLYQFLSTKRFLDAAAESELDRILFQDKSLEPTDLANSNTQLSLEIMERILLKFEKENSNLVLAASIIPSYDEVQGPLSHNATRFVLEQAVQKICEKVKLPVVSVVDEFKSMASEQLYDEKDRHLNAKGHRAAAEIIAEFIKPLIKSKL